jgi:hypothetical protein
MNIFDKLEKKHSEMMNAPDELDQTQGYFNAWITAAEMEKLLAANYDGNRDLYKQTYRKYVRAMNLGRWELNPNPLVFFKREDDTWSYNLADGQHRATAQIETGLTLPYGVCINKSISVYKILDQGKVRTNVDLTGAPKGVCMPIQYLLRSASAIVYPEAADVQRVLCDTVGELLAEVEHDIKPPQTGRSPWKQNGFRAAYAMAIMTGRIERKTAFNVYTGLCRNELKEWPDVFVSLYRQMMEGQIHINRAGASLDNDYFMRGLYALSHHSAKGKQVAIHNKFRSDVKESVFNIMKKYGTEELRLVVAA